MKDTKAPIIQAKDCNEVKLTFHIVDAEKINPIIIENKPLLFQPFE